MEFFQVWFEAAVAVIGLIIGWVLRTLWSDMKDLSTKVQSIEILVAGEYVKKAEIAQLSDSLFKKLDRIEDKLDGKADK
jgi:hypothetical protein